MAMTVAELAGYIDLDDSGFQSGTRTVERSFERMTSDIESGLRDSERDFDRWADEIGDAGRDAARELERQVERGLDDVERSVRDSGEDAGGSFTDGMGAEGAAGMGPMSGRFAALMQKAGPWLAAGAVIGGILMKALEGAMEKQDVAAKLSAQVGAFGPRSAELGDAAGELYAKGYGESLGDVGEALKGVIQNMSGMRDASKADLKDVAASALSLSEILDEDVGRTTRAVAQMIRTGMAKDAKEAFDLLTVGAQRGANASEDLLDTFNEYSTQFRRIGLDGRTAMGMITQAMEAGARDSDQVADALGQFGERALAGGKPVEEAFQSIGLDADKMAQMIGQGGPVAARALQQTMDALRKTTDEQTKLNAAAALFGDPANVMGEALFAIDPSKAVDALGQIDGAAKKAGDTLHDTASNRIEQFKRGLQQGLVDFIGGPVLGGLEQLATKAQEALSGWAKDNPEIIQELQSLWEDVQAIFNEGIEAVKAIWKVIGPFITDELGRAITMVSGILKGLFTIIKGVMQTITGVLTGDWKKAWGGVKTIFNGAKKVLGSIVRGIIDMVVNIVTGAHKLMVRAGKAVVEGLWNGIQSLGGWIKDRVGALIQNIIPGPVRKALGIASPSKVMAVIGEHVMRGLWVGLTGKERKRVQKEMGKAARQVSASFKNGLKGNREESEIKAKMGKIADAIKKAFEKIAKNTTRDDTLLARTKATTKRLVGLARERAKAMEKLADMREFRDKIKDGVRSFAGLTSIDMGEGPTTSAKVRSGLQGKVSQLRKFAGHIRQLMKRGLPKSLLRQILEAGPEAGADLAAALAGGSSGDLKAIAAAQREVDAISNSLGKLGMDAAYGKGVYESLQKEKTRIEKLMDSIARSFARSVTNALTQGAGKGKGAVLGTVDINVSVDGKGVVKKVRKEVRKGGGSSQNVLGRV